MQELKERIESLDNRLTDVLAALGVPDMEKRLEGLQAQGSREDLWDNQEHARAVMQELGDTRKELSEIKNLQDEIRTLSELSKEGELGESLEKDVARIEKQLNLFGLKTFLSGKYDKKPALFSIHAGQGGTEAMDWASMLFRMYTRYFERKGWGYEILDQTAGEGAGIKSMTLRITVPHAYGYLKKEGGTHRLVRQSPFNADSLRQTSFARVEVMPELDEVDLPDIEIRDEDLEWQFVRSGGKGGQNVNKVNSAVRLTHTPTGISVHTSSERSQEQNRKYALAHLRAKLWALAQERITAEREDLQGEYSPASWGTQIRSYVLHPYKMVKDLRTKEETSQADAVLDGDLDQFIEAELRAKV